MKRVLYNIQHLSNSIQARTSFWRSWVPSQMGMAIQLLGFGTVRTLILEVEADDSSRVAAVLCHVLWVIVSTRVQPARVPHLGVGVCACG